MIANQWPAEFCARYGGGFPRHYLALDVETSGFKREDVVMEIGHCLVENGEIKDQLNLVLDWRSEPGVYHNWLLHRLEHTRESMAAAGKPYRLSYSTMEAEGTPAGKVLAFYHDFLKAISDRRLFYVGHSARFEERMLDAMFKRFHIGDRKFSFPQDRYFDTSALERADQVNAMPKPGESLYAYFSRVLSMRLSGVHSSLDEHMVDKYKLVEKYGVDRSKMHQAGYDALVTHYVMLEFGEAYDRGAISADVAPSVAVVRPQPVAPVRRSPPLQRAAPAVVVRPGARLRGLRVR